jgi:hypothetical protein
MIVGPALMVIGFAALLSLRILILLVSLIILLTVIAVLVRTASQKRTATPAEEFPEWDPKKPWESLLQLYSTTLKQGGSAVDWYRVNIRSKRAGSQIIRLLAILLFSVGALIPLVINIARIEGDQKGLLDPQWGYISFATAAAFLAADKYYGFSTGWIRYIKTQLALERALADLRYDWLILTAKITNQQPSPDQIQAVVQKLKDFVDFVRTQIEQETEAWVVEFQASLSDLTASLKAETEATKPGTVQVTVTNSDKFEKIMAVLDQVTEMMLHGNQCLFPSVAPGVHGVMVRGTTEDGKESTGTAVVTVTAGAQASVSITVPTPAP